MKGKNCYYIPIYSVSEDETIYVGVEHWEGSFDKHNNYVSPRLFRLCPKVTKFNINMRIHGLQKKCLFKNHYIRQYGALANIVTTRHKLQGNSKDNIIVGNRLCGVKNWF